MVYKFGGSSVATAERMIEVAEIVCSFQDQAPLVVLSAMGKVNVPTELVNADSCALSIIARLLSAMISSCCAIRHKAATAALHCCSAHDPPLTSRSLGSKML